MSKLIVALAALTLGLSRGAAAQSPEVMGAAHTAEVGGLEIGAVPRYRALHTFTVPKSGTERSGVAPSSRAVWVPGYWHLQGNPKGGPRAGWIFSWTPGYWAQPPAKR